MFDRSVTVEWKKLDRYERIVGKVLISGQDANLEQVRRGSSLALQQTRREQEPLDRATYSQADRGTGCATEDSGRSGAYPAVGLAQSRRTEVKTPSIHVSVEHGGSLEPVIQIYDADQAQPKVIKMNLEAAHKLLEDLLNSIELVESLIPGPDDITH